jgi:hypothetical protein
MVPLLFWMAVAAQAPNTNAPENIAGEQCRSAIAHKLALTISSVTIVSERRSRGGIVLDGSFSGYRPPVPPPPGMAAPLHVIDIKYDYRCWLRGGAVRRVWTRKIEE